MVLLLLPLVVVAVTARALSMQTHTRCRCLLSTVLGHWLSSSSMAAVGVGECQVLLPVCCEQV
jgi:hypothetical protein